MAELTPVAEIYRDPKSAVEAANSACLYVKELIARGAYGSDKAIGADIKGERRVELPKLLGLSPLSAKHANVQFQLLAGTAERPVHAIHTTEELAALRNQYREIDMAFMTYQQADPFSINIHNFPNSATRRSLSSLSDGTDYKFLSGFTFSSKEIPFWQVEYSYDKGIAKAFQDNDLPNVLTTAKSLFGRSAGIQPLLHRHFLLNFYFTEKSVDENREFWTQIIAGRMQALAPSTITMDSDSGRFSTVNFRTDTDEAIKLFEANAAKIDREYPDLSVKDRMLAALFRQEQEALRLFQVVNLGTANFSGKTWHVYSGAERPLQREKAHSGSGRKSWLPAWAQKPAGSAS